MYMVETQLHFSLGICLAKKSYIPLDSKAEKVVHEHFYIQEMAPVKMKLNNALIYVPKHNVK